MDLKIQKEDDEDLLVKLEGEINIYNAVSFKNRFIDFLSKNKNITVDISEVASMDTCGFQLLMALKKSSIQKNRKVTYINHSDEMLKFLDLYGAAGLLGDKLIISKDSRKKYTFKYGLKSVKF